MRVISRTLKLFAATALFYMSTICAPTYASDIDGFPDIEVNCEKDISLLSPTAQDKYISAQVYKEGLCDFKQSYKTALKLYIKAANEGHLDAQYRLAEYYFTGKNGEPNYIEAKKWYLKAAEQGHGPSQLRLGFLYAEKHFKGLTPDYAEAEKWFLKAAEQNAGDAQFRLGNFYRNYKKPPEIEKAITWLEKASEGGHRIAMFDLARLLKDRGDTEGYLEWLTKSAELESLPALLTLGRLYREGEMVEKDMEKSRSYLKKAAKKGSYRAKMLLKEPANDNEESEHEPASEE